MVILINAFVLAPVSLPSYKVANKDIEVHVKVTDKAADMLFYARRGKSISLVCSSSLPSVGRPKVTVKGQRIEMEVKNSDHGWRRLIDLSSGTGILDITDKVVGKAQQPRVGDATSMYRLLRHFDTAPIGYRSRHCAGVTNAKFGCAVAALNTSVGLDQIGDNLIVRPLTTSGSPSKYKLFVGDSDEFLPNADYVGKWLWYNSKSLVNPGLPQTMPFKFYTPIVLNFGQVGENEEESGEVGHKEEEGPWEVVKTPKDEIGWPKGRKTIDLDMAAMAAWGMKWWGTTLGQKEWAERGDHFMNLTLETAEEGDPFASRLFTTETKKAADVEAKTSESTMYWQYRWAKKWPQSEQAEEIRERMEKAQEEIARSTEDSVLQRLRIERYLAAAEPVGENDRPIRVQLPQSRSIEEWIALLNISVDRKSIAEAHTYANQVALAQNLAKTKSPNQFGMIGQTASESSRAGYALIRAGALLDRKDLMERGVASMKWA
ncbi:MAG: hypothetical protein JNM34_08460, partial [Chthonomonadaceae bacterium]|nr:hypothetical protein [Chthonomonadaceae bacterium]